MRIIRQGNEKENMALLLNDFFQSKMLLVKRNTQYQLYYLILREETINTLTISFVIEDIFLDTKSCTNDINYPTRKLY